MISKHKSRIIIMLTLISLISIPKAHTDIAGPITGTRVAVDGEMIIGDTTIFSGGTLQINAGVTVAFAGSHTLTINPGGLLYVAGLFIIGNPTTRTISPILTNNATGTPGSGIWIFGGGDIVHINGTFNNNGDVLIQSSGSTYNQGQIIDAGSLTPTTNNSSSGTIEILQPAVYDCVLGNFYNGGLVKINGNAVSVNFASFKMDSNGYASFYNGVTTAGIVSVEGPQKASFTVSGGVFHNGETAQGTINITGSPNNIFLVNLNGELINGSSATGIINVSASAQFNLATGTPTNKLTLGVGAISGTLNLQGGTINNNAGITIDRGLVNITGGTLNNVNPTGKILFNTENATLQLQGGTISSASTIADSFEFARGTCNLQSGNLNGRYTIRNTTDSIIFNNFNSIVSPPFSNILGASITSNITNGDIVIPSGQTMVVASGKQLTLEASALITTPSAAGGNFNNNGGTVNNSGAIATYNIFLNSGTINNDGTVNNDGAFTNNNGGTFINNEIFNNDSGTLTNDETFNNNGELNNASGATITNADTMYNNSPGIITNEGTFNNNDALVNYYIINNHSSFSNNSPLTNNLAFNNYGTFNNNNGDFENNGGIANYGSFTNSDELINNGDIFNMYNGTFTNNGIMSGGGNFADLSSEESVLPDALIYTVTEGLNFIIYKPQRVSVNGSIINKSPNTIEIFGELYTYSFILNGESGAPGTISIEPDGALYLLSALLQNGDVNSTVSLQAGGNLFNYYGDIDVLLGDILLKAGGNFDNVRGNHPGAFTINTGGNFADTAEINLVRNLDLDLTWSITQDSVINGYGNKINFGPNGGICVQDGASLMFDDVTLNNVSGNKIRCTDSRTTLSIHNVIWNQDGNYTLTEGSFHVAGEWIIGGNGTALVYQSDVPSMIESNATMYFLNTILDYDSTTPGLIRFEDEAARIMLEHGTIKATQNCTMSDGTLTTQGLGTLIGTGTLNLNGLDDIQIVGSLRRRGTVIL